MTESLVSTDSNYLGGIPLNIVHLVQVILEPHVFIIFVYVLFEFLDASLAVSLELHFNFFGAKIFITHVRLRLDFFEIQVLDNFLLLALIQH